MQGRYRQLEELREEYKMLLTKREAYSPGSEDHQELTEKMKLIEIRGKLLKMALKREPDITSFAESVFLGGQQ